MLIIFICILTDDQRIKPFTAGSDARVKWSSWKRAIDIYFEANDVSDAKKKKQKLLHLGGPELQEVYFSFPETKVTIMGADGKPVLDDKGKETFLDEYGTIIFQLDNFFAPRLNITYERHVLRGIRQGENEQFEDFCVRIRNQIQKCEYCSKDADREVIQQIVEGCKSKQLRTRLLETERTLLEATNLGRTLEDIGKQSRSFEPEPTEIQRVDRRPAPA